MKVMLVVPWDARCGGVVSVAGLLGRYLQDRGHDVLFLHTDEPQVVAKKTTTTWGFPGYRLGLGVPAGARHPMLRTLMIAALLPVRLYQLIRLIRRHRIEVINIHYPLPSYVCFAICRFLLPIRLVTSIHGADVVKRRRQRATYAIAMRILLGCSHLVVANSVSFREEFLARFPRVRAKTIVIHNGVDLGELLRHGPAVPARRDRYVLCIAVQERHKGVDVLVRAFARMLQSVSEVRLVVVGDGPRRREFEDLACALDVADRVDFVGWKGRRDVVSLLNGCDAFVLPSRSEPLGIVILEALACRRAVVASAIGGIPEVIAHERSGLLVEPDNPAALAEAMTAVLTDPALRDGLAGHGYDTVVKRFRYEHTGAAYEIALGGARP
jgi:glycosyltransferase involved in cell wall biosynthesis